MVCKILLKFLSSAEIIRLTIDQNIYYQQNITQYNIAIIGVKAQPNSSNDWEPWIPLIEEVLGVCKAGRIYKVDLWNTKKGFKLLLWQMI